MLFPLTLSNPAPSIPLRHSPPRSDQRWGIGATPPPFPTPLLRPRAPPHSALSVSPWLTFLSALPLPENGPIVLPPSADASEPTALQLSTSVLLTGAITVFLFRSLRRRAKRAKELRVRSSGVKSLKEEALDNLKAMGSATLDDGAPPSPLQALLGGIAAGVVALILYNFTTTIEGALNRQAISDSFSVRQMTITVRTIVNGLCYLATFVFAINSVGLFLYSGQLAINSFIETPASNKTPENNKGQKSEIDSSSETSVENVETDDTS
ncbi:hypothetical protein AMTRI_Chr01g111250 [Amborella trichopoda]|uniref:Uncharacterized protein n=1 Tax=Amborella trichopoda TaxID=13333 RepID=W1PVH1_AMBTC|nr:uncharacterized protein LOC18442275 [Amborella trichopoda]ERN14027.1 hypothetical protein AMTR_s00021p00200120 [Amborella trichopoda]|eukprot:XP_006852560.1 uncharacterized protein LOC18442275 [Amborella trichopoda]